MNRRRDRVSAALSILGAVLAIVVAFGSFYYGRTRLIVDDDVAAATVSDLDPTELLGENERLRAQVAALTRRLEATQQRPNVKPPASADISRVEAAIDELSKRQRRIEDAIARDPVRALEVPLLRRDLENMQGSQAQAIASIDQRVSQVFELNKWLLGAGALSLLAIALSTVLSHWKGRAND